MSATEAVLSMPAPLPCELKDKTGQRIRQLLHQRKAAEKQCEIVSAQRDAALADLAKEREARQAAAQELSDLQSKIDGFTKDETEQLKAREEMETKKRELYGAALIACSRQSGLIRYCPDWDNKFESVITSMSTQLLLEILKISQLGQGHNPAALVYSLAEKPEICLKLSEWCKSFETIGDAIRALHFVSNSISGEVALLTAAMPAQGKEKTECLIRLLSKAHRSLVRSTSRPSHAKSRIPLRVQPRAAKQTRNHTTRSASEIFPAKSTPSG